MSFNTFLLDENLNKAIEELGYKTPTEVQALAIPKLLEKDIDFVAQAQTGTGKTAAFGLPLLQKIDVNNKSIQALILTPTRELANQVEQEIQKLGKYLNVKSLAIFGGASYDKQIRYIKKEFPQIIVGTPGRVIDLIKRNVLNFNDAKYAILDEADEMLNMGFLEDVQLILSKFNANTKTWMFSATMPRPIINLVNNNFNNPEIIRLAKKTLSAENIEQTYYIVQRRHRFEALCRILDTSDSYYGIVFCQTKLDTQELGGDLAARGYRVEILNGDMGQAQRDAAMKKFKLNKVKLLVCTDVAARGIDVNNLTHVINYGMPREMESYVHRIGRTGRAGMKGKAISIIEQNEKFRIKRIESFINATLKKESLPSIKNITESMISKETLSITPLIESVLERGDEFIVDESFELFKKAFDNLEKNDVLKVFFSKEFKNKIRRLKEMGDINESVNNNNKRSRDRKQKTGTGCMRLFVNAGKDDGLNINNLIQNISGSAKIESKNIQNISLLNRFSFFEVPEKTGRDILKIKGMTMNKRNVRFEESRPR